MRVTLVVLAIECDQEPFYREAHRFVGEEIIVDLSAPKTVGRSPSRADIALPATAVGSTRPYLLRESSGAVLLQDRSHNGHSVNGVLGAHESVLRHGDVLAIGPFQLRVQLEERQNPPVS